MGRLARLDAAPHVLDGFVAGLRARVATSRRALVHLERDADRHYAAPHARANLEDARRKMEAEADVLAFVGRALLEAPLPARRRA